MALREPVRRNPYPAGGGERGRAESAHAPRLRARAGAHQARAHAAYGIVLGDGEAEAIALALELGSDQVVLDELRGRSVATRLGLSVVGTLGVLRAAKLSGRIPEVKGPLATLVAARFWIELTLVKALLLEMGESE